jgi:hypothetical protein
VLMPLGKSLYEILRDDEEVINDFGKSSGGQ